MIVIQFSRQSREGQWALAGRLVVRPGRDADLGELDGRLASEALLALYWDNVGFGTTCLDGVEYRWEEVLPGRREREEGQPTMLL